MFKPKISELLEPVMVYKKKNVTYLPHYSKKDIYVSPGYGFSHFNQFSPEELEGYGFERGIELLSRPKDLVEHSASIEPQVAALLKRMR